MIGAIGSRGIADVILFEVSDHKTLTIIDFMRSNSVRFAKHDVLLRKPVSQYIGPDLDKLSFKIMLKSYLGVNPKSEFDKLIYLQRDGELVSVLMGTSALGVYRWRIADLGIPYEIIDNQGRCISSTVDISFEEYV
jgi:phage protein U